MTMDFDKVVLSDRTHATLAQVHRRMLRWNHPTPPDPVWWVLSPLLSMAPSVSCKGNIPGSDKVSEWAAVQAALLVLLGRGVAGVLPDGSRVLLL